MKDYKRGEYVEETTYCVNFYSHPDGGYGFPCDKDGNVDTNDPNYECWKDNYAWCMEQGPDHFPYAFNEIEERKHRWREPDTGICNCGHRIELHNEYLGACECPYCGQWWNLFGQELNRPERWSEGDDW